MSIIWVIEKPSVENCHYAPCLADILMGNYPVRVFASAFSFQNLLRSKKPVAADLVLVDCDNLANAEELLHLANFLKISVPHAIKIFVGSRAEQANLLNAEHLKHGHFLTKPIEALNLVLFVDQLLSHKSKLAQKSSQLRFRDIDFDLVNFTIRVESSDEIEQLPLKEAQILRLLMEKTGHILSRDEIQQKIWTGLKVTPRTIDSHVSRLRGRLKNSEVSISSVYGGGYQLR